MGLTDKELFEIGVLTLCQRVHMHNTGADMDDWENVPAYVAYLRHRLEDWNMGPSQSRVYDDAARRLIAAALAEYRGVTRENARSS